MRVRSFAVLTALTLLVGMFAAPPAAAASTLVVDDDGQAAVGDCDAIQMTFPTIQDAVDAAEPGDTIVVCPGTYEEHVVIAKTLSVLGAKAGVHGRTRTDPAVESVVTRPSEGEPPPTGFDVAAPNVYLAGFWLTGWQTGVQAAYEAASLRLVENVFADNNTGSRLLGETSVQARNAFRDNHEGTFHVGSSGTIANNEFDQNVVGVSMDGLVGEINFSTGEDIRIRNNTFTVAEGFDKAGPWGAIFASFTTGLRILDNTMTGAANGIWLAIANEGVTIERNDISGFDFQGILVGGFGVAGDVNGGYYEYGNGPITVRRNTIAENFAGIRVEYGGLNESMVVRENVIAGNGGVPNGEPSASLVPAGGGILNYDDTQVDAARNWWGDASGPSGWSIGTGDYVSDKVRFFPWATNPTFTAFAQCTKTGTPGPDRLIGTAGTDILCGLAGEDRLEGRGDDDLLLGDAGNDLLLGGGGDDAILGSQSNDNLRGNAGFDSLQGQANEDVCIVGPDGGQTSTCE